ncbi:MAG: hypothetical protein R3338_05225, partial [Thermoanaerobaculia bacterium]|nr:hypothetical protein [Thermoanaerobaculia bacterium]
MRDRFPELLVESLEGEQRELAFRHIENCETCGPEWAATRETWRLLGVLPEVPVPSRVRANFEETIRELEASRAQKKIVPFRRPAWHAWAAQAAAVILLVAASFFAGTLLNEPDAEQGQRAFTEPATIRTIAPIAEQMFVPASQLSPGIQGRPDIRNVNVFSEEGEIGVTFDLTSTLTVKGQPGDESLVELISYVLQNGDNATHSRSEVIQWVKDTYSTSDAEPELVEA